MRFLLIPVFALIFSFMGAGLTLEPAAEAEKIAIASQQKLEQLDVNSAAEISLSVSPKDGDISNLVFESSDETLVEYSDGKIVTYDKEGSADVWAVLPDGTKSNVLTVTVTDKAKVKAAEQEKLEAEAKAAEQEKLEAEAKEAEQAKLEAEAKAAEQAKVEAEAKAAEQAKLEAEAKEAEQAKLEAEAKAAEEAQAAQAAADARQQLEAYQQEPSVSVGEEVLITKTGEKYHKRKCGNGTYYPATLEEAESRGLTPCSKCF